jgi:hypothetical protein
LKEAEQPTLVLLFALQNVLLLLASVSLYIRERHLRDKAERRLDLDDQLYGRVLAKMTSNFHSLSHRSRDLLNRVNCNPHDLPPEDVARVLCQICDEIREAFEAIFSRQNLAFHVAIKAVVDADKKLRVATLARDAEMCGHHNFRVNDAEPLLVCENTAFDMLLSSRVTDFCDDDLTNVLHYVNSSPNWRDRYNAVMVVPIRRNHVEASNENEDIFELVGFIGVDCVRGKGSGPVFRSETGMPRMELKDLLLGYADCVYGILKRGRTYSGSGRTFAGNYRIDEMNLQFIRDVHAAFLGWILKPQASTTSPLRPYRPSSQISQSSKQ